MLTFRELCAVKCVSHWCHDEADLTFVCNYHVRDMFHQFRGFSAIGQNLDFKPGVYFARRFDLPIFQQYCEANTKSVVLLEGDDSRLHDTNTGDFYQICDVMRWKLPLDEDWSVVPENNALGAIPGTGAYFSAHLHWNVSGDFGPELYLPDGTFTMPTIPEQVSFFRAHGDSTWRPFSEFDADDEQNRNIVFEYGSMRRETPFISFLTSVIDAMFDEAPIPLFESFLRVLATELGHMFPNERPRLLIRHPEFSVAELAMRCENDERTQLLFTYCPECFDEPTFKYAYYFGASQLSFAVTHIKSDDFFMTLFRRFDRDAQRQAFFTACATRSNVRINLILDYLTEDVCKSFYDMDDAWTHEYLCIEDPICCYVYYEAQDSPLIETIIAHVNHVHGIFVPISVPTLKRLIFLFWDKFDYSVYDNDDLEEKFMVISPLACVAATARSTAPFDLFSKLFALVKSTRGGHSCNFRQQLLALLMHALHEEETSTQVVNHIWNEISDIAPVANNEMEEIFRELSNLSDMLPETLRQYEGSNFFNCLQTYECFDKYRSSDESESE